MTSIAIITARGGSKRIPKKNIKEFCGKPILAYSIEAALQSKIFDEVMVSTDSKEIAGIAKQYGASVPFLRSEKTSNDFATTYDVLKEVLDNYERLGNCFDYACCIYPTAPFVTSKKLVNAYEMILEKKAETILPIVRYSFPPQRAFIMNDGFVRYKTPEFMNSRSQDLEAMFHDCGQFYFFRVKSFKEQEKLIMKNCIGIEMPEEEVQDIDNISDWKIAELKFEFMKNKSGD